MVKYTCLCLLLLMNSCMSYISVNLTNASTRIPFSPSRTDYELILDTEGDEFPSDYRIELFSEYSDWRVKTSGVEGIIRSEEEQRVHFDIPVLFGRENSVVLESPKASKSFRFYFPESSLLPGAFYNERRQVLTSGSEGGFDAGLVESPSIVKVDEGKFLMVYTGYDSMVSNPRIGLLESSNLLDWKRVSSGPLFDPSALGLKSGGATAPYLYYKDKLFHLFFLSLDNNGYEIGEKKIYHLTSSDLKDFTLVSEQAVLEAMGDGWMSEAVWHPSIVEREGLFYMFFNASGHVRNRSEETVGLAVSRDLHNWKPVELGNPLLTGSGIPGSWDETGRAGDPSVIRLGRNWIMAYYSLDYGNKAQDGFAYADEQHFPFRWQPDRQNPRLKTGTPESFDGKMAHKPFLIFEDGKLYHFYTAVDKYDRRSIAVAIQDFSRPVVDR